MNIEQKIAQMLVVGFYGEDLSANPGFLEELRAYSPGGVILFARQDHAGLGNIKNSGQLAELTSAIRENSAITPFIALDQEGGKVSRLVQSNGFTDTASAEEIGRVSSERITEAWAKTIARDLKRAGINLNLAPVVDVDVYHGSPVIGKLERCFSESAEVVSRQAEIFCRVMNKQGIYNCLKHFPGHGSARQDSHLGFTDITASWQEKELEPYRYLIKQGVGDMVMTGHLYNRELDRDYPASLSREIISGLLREKLGFRKLVITDDLQMRAISSRYREKEYIKLAIEAGNNLLIIANNDASAYLAPSKLVTMIKDLIAIGEIKEESIDESCQLIMGSKAKILTPR